MTQRYPHVNKMNQYCRDVISGKIDACLYVQQACQRHLSDLKKSQSKSYRWKFDKEKAERACEFIECLVHVKAKWAGSYLILEPWQCFIVCSIFGWVDKTTGFRRFTKASVYVPRKNGKSPLAAGIALYMFLADSEMGAEIYVGASTEKQAWEVFRPAKDMVNKSPDIKEYFGVEVFAKSMFHTETASRFEPVIGNPGDGGSVHLAVIDEFHEQPTDALYSTMSTGTVARDQPLILVISTTGVNLACPCKDDFDYLIEILSGAIEDDRFFGIIFSIDKGDDWQDFKNWIKANPNYNISVSHDKLYEKYLTALQKPSERNKILCKHLNLWLSVDTAWMDLPKLLKCCDVKLLIDSMKGKRCVGALDLASKLDLCSFAQVFWDEFKVYGFCKFYLPRETVEKPENTHYQTWEHEERLTVIEGQRIDYSVIKEDVVNFHSMFQPDCIAYDPTFAAQLSFDLQGEGVNMVEVRQVVLQFSDPMKELEADIYSQVFQYNGCPIIYWCFSNVVAHYDKKDCIYPNKPNRKSKIDGVVALIMAYNAMMRLKSTPKEPEPGIIVI